MKHFFPFIVIVTVLYFSSCANQGNPTGGPRDTIPPAWTKSYPPNKSLNYKGRTFRFEFDERVSADQMKQKFNITPHTENKYKTVVKKYTLEMEFEEDFDDSTTYTFNFADAVVDVTEKNPVENFTYAFSTGPYIDSIYVNGTVKDLYKNTPLKQATVALYAIDDTLDLFTGKGRYFTKTNEDGQYLIENIKTGYYRLYGFDDKDKNLQNNPQEEMHGFFSDSINLNISTDSLHMKLQLLDASQPEFVRSKTTGIYFDVLYNKYLSDYSLSLLTGKKKSIPKNNFYKDNTTIRFYPDGSVPIDKDSLQLKIDAIDSLGNSLTDTVYIKFAESRRKAESFSFTMKPSASFKILDSIPFLIEFSKPIVTTINDSLVLSYDTLKQMTIPDSIIIWNKRRTKASFKIPIDNKFISNNIEQVQAKRQAEDSIVRAQMEADTLFKPERPRRLPLPKNQIKFSAKKAAFISIDNDSTEAKPLSFSFFDPEKTGEVSGAITTEYKSYTLQLVTNNYTVVSELRNDSTFRFKHVQPGKYTFRVLIDENEDGIWSPGNILKNTEPEPIWFYSETFDVKAGWFIELFDDNKLTF